MAHPSYCSAGISPVKRGLTCHGSDGGLQHGVTNRSCCMVGSFLLGFLWIRSFWPTGTASASAHVGVPRLTVLRFGSWLHHLQRKHRSICFLFIVFDRFGHVMLPISKGSMEELAPGLSARPERRLSA
jgi:hypothetical protein